MSADSHTGFQLVIHVFYVCGTEDEPRTSNCVLKWITTELHRLLSLMFSFSSVSHLIDSIIFKICCLFLLLSLLKQGPG